MADQDRGIHFASTSSSYNFQRVVIRESLRPFSNANQSSNQTIKSYTNLREDTHKICDVQSPLPVSHFPFLLEFSFFVPTEKLGRAGKIKGTRNFHQKSGKRGGHGIKFSP